MAIQVEQLEKEKSDMQTKLKTMAKRLDHLERAYRREELPLLEQDYQRQKQADRELHEEIQKVKAKKHVEDHRVEMLNKKRMIRMLVEFKKFRSQHETSLKARLGVGQ